MGTTGWPFGSYPPGGLQALGPHVTAYYAGGFPASNSAIVRGTEATLVFDPNCFRFARELRDAVDASGPPLRQVIVSHAHDDHTMGSELFAPPAHVLARMNTRERLQRNIIDGSVPGTQYEAGYAGAAEEGAAVRIVVPDQTIEAPATLDLGGDVLVHLRPEGPAHTDGDLWAFVEPDGVALCGDLWYARCEPYVGSGSVIGLLDAVGRIRALGSDRCLPGHGPARSIEPIGVDPVDRYLRWMLDRVAEAVRGGLTGRELGRTIRRAFEEQRSRTGGIDFPVRIPGFLEVTAAAAERDVRATNAR